MDIRAEKLRLIELLLYTNNPSIIRKVKSIFQTEETQDIWEELSTDQQKEIDKALEEVNSGKTIPFESFIKQYR